MRRVMFTVAAAVLIAGAVPASALARHHHKHHARHHAKIRRFGDQNAPATSTSPSDNAGKVVDFANGVLTISLNDGSTVKGMVTNDTEIECTSIQSQTTHSEGDGGSGDQSSGEDNQSSSSGDQGDNDQNEAQGEDQNEAQGEDQNEAQGEDQNEAQGAQSASQTSRCSSSSLTKGAVVHEASLRIGSDNSWQKVELVS